MTVTIQIPDEQALSFAAEMQQRGYLVEVMEDIPTWHKQGLDAIRAQSKPGDYMALEDFLKEWESE